MASIKRLPSGAVQLCIRNRLLPKPLYATFDSETAARQYATQLEALLAQGIVPTALLERTQAKKEIWTVTRCIVEYLRHNVVPASDVDVLDTLRTQVSIYATGGLNYEWAEAWVRSMKRDLNLAPSTIRHRHGALARCFDWMCRKHPDILAQNPLRLMKRGFSQYNEDDARHLAAGGREARRDTERNRRLEPQEEERILAVLCGQDRLFFTLALETAMRMRELYTLTAEQVSIQKRTIHLDRTKNGDGRQVPLSSVACDALGVYLLANATDIRARDGRLFSYWKGPPTTKELKRTTFQVSRLFARAFEAAGAADLRFHDLRHEATCRLYERTKLSDLLISRITGHRDIRMLKRYASMRGSDLAAHLW